MAQHIDKHAQYHVVTANRLNDGLVVYFDKIGQWQSQLKDAAIADSQSSAQALLARAEAEAQKNNSVLDIYLFPLTDHTTRTPASVREHIRADGPTIEFLPADTPDNRPKT